MSRALYIFLASLILLTACVAQAAPQSEADKVEVQNSKTWDMQGYFFLEASVREMDADDCSRGIPWVNSKTVGVIMRDNNQIWIGDYRQEGAIIGLSPSSFLTQEQANQLGSYLPSGYELELKLKNDGTLDLNIVHCEKDGEHWLQSIYFK